MTFSRRLTALAAAAALGLGAMTAPATAADYDTFDRTGTQGAAWLLGLTVLGAAALASQDRDEDDDDDAAEAPATRDDRNWQTDWRTQPGYESDGPRDWRSDNRRTDNRRDWRDDDRSDWRNGNRNDRRDQRGGNGRGRDDRLGRREIPRSCLFEARTNRGNGIQRMYPVRCLERAGVNTRRLPERCLLNVASRNTTYVGYLPRCLRAEGFEIVARD